MARAGDLRVRVLAVAVAAAVPAAAGGWLAALAGVAIGAVVGELLVVRALRRPGREALLRELVEVHDQERRRLADDIHDDTIQALTAAGLRVQRLRRHAETGELQRMAGEAEDAVGRALSELRGLMAALAPEGTDEATGPQLRRVLVDELGPHDIAWDLDVRLADEPPAEVRSLVLRNVREAVRNVAAHAKGASLVTVTVEHGRQAVEVKVRDDGIGFDVDLPLDGGHRGLELLRRRTERAGGWVSVHSAPGAGAVLRFGVPV